MTKPLDTSPKALRKFGILFGSIAVLMTVYLVLKGRGGWPWFACGAVFFYGTGLLATALLRPIYVGWMKFAFVLGWINTRIFLGGFFYLILTPIGLVLRIMGKDLLDQRLDPSASSYWLKRDAVPFDPKRTEKMY